MKNTFFISLLLLKITLCQSQNPFTGNWYSKDKTRTFKIFLNDTRYEAILFTSQRKGDSTGVPVLVNLTYKHRRKIYQGLMRAMDDGMMVPVKIRLKENGKNLQIKLRRLVIFPVFLSWTKME